MDDVVGLLPSWMETLGPVRAFRAVGGTPRFIERAAGAHIFDAEGRPYIDYIGSWGPMILGHGHPAVLEAVHKAALEGLSFGAPTEREIELADRASVLLGLELGIRPERVNSIADSGELGIQNVGGGGKTAEELARIRSVGRNKRRKLRFPKRKREVTTIRDFVRGQNPFRMLSAHRAEFDRSAEVKTAVAPLVWMFVFQQCERANALENIVTLTIFRFPVVNGWTRNPSVAARRRAATGSAIRPR